MALFFIVGFILIALIFPYMNLKIEQKQDEIIDLENNLNRRMRNYQEIIRYEYLVSIYESNYMIFSSMDENKENDKALEDYCEKWEGYLVDLLRATYSFYSYGKTDLSELPSLEQTWKELDISELKNEMTNLNNKYVMSTGKELDQAYNKIYSLKEDINTFRKWQNRYILPIGIVFQLIGLYFGRFSV